MNNKKNMFIACFVIILMCLLITKTSYAKSVVQKRLDEVVKEFPDGSKFSGTVYVNGHNGSGCNGLVMYVTIKIFHNAYVPSSDTYKQIGKTASTGNNKKMKELFKKAKIGDVVRWRNGYTDSHFAIYLYSNSEGIYVYEANFGQKDKVWYEHFWSWEHMKTWPTDGADKVNVYRSKNYNQVNKKKTAINYKKGDEFSVKGIHYRVTDESVFGGKVEVAGYDEGKEERIPVRLFVNRCDEKNINSNESCYEIFSAKKKNLSSQMTYEVKNK